MFAFHQSVISTAVWDRLRFFFGFLGLLDSVARDVELENYAVMNKPVDRGRRGHRVLEDPFPLGKGQVAGDEHATALVTFRQQGEENFHLSAALLHVPEIVDDQSFKVRQFFNEAAQLEIPFGNQEILH